MHATYPAPKRSNVAHSPFVRIQREYSANTAAKHQLHNAKHRQHQWRSTANINSNDMGGCLAHDLAGTNSQNRRTSRAESRRIPGPSEE